MNQWHQIEDPDVNPHHIPMDTLFLTSENYTIEKRKHLQQMEMVWLDVDNIEECK